MRKSELEEPVFPFLNPFKSLNLAQGVVSEEHMDSPELTVPVPKCHELCNPLIINELYTWHRRCENTFSLVTKTGMRRFLWQN
jgi:hypothetical protein